MLDWCNQIANLAVDAMIDAKLIEFDNLEDAVNITSTEIMVRLVMKDYPPLCKK